MDAYEFGKVLKDNNFVFGAGEVESAKALRDLADKIEQKIVVIQSCRVTSEIRDNEFATTKFELCLSEKRKREIAVTPEKLHEIQTITSMPVEKPTSDFLQSIEIAESLKYNH